MKIGPQFWPAELFNIKVDEPVGSCQMSDNTILLSTIVKLTFLDTCASYFCQAFKSQMISEYFFYQQKRIDKFLP